MQSAGSSEKLSATGGGSVASRVKNLFSNTPITRRKRAMSLDALSNPVAEQPTIMFGAPLNDLVARDHVPIPFLVRKVIRYVEEHGLTQVGIYRINGNAKFIEKLRELFDTVGDAHFSPEDIASIAGLLKLFLRELPDGIVPDILMTHFVAVQQTYSSEATQEAIEALQRCLQYLPESNFNVLRYLMRHLVRVADRSDANKMTAVSLSIVFGPSVFHCGSGMEGLKLQGYSNATVCRMIQNYRELFTKGRKDGGSMPERPRPYSEHIAEKRRNQEESRQDLSATYDPTASCPQRRDPVAVRDDSSSHRRNPRTAMDTSSPHRRNTSAVMHTSLPHRKNDPVEVIDAYSPHRRNTSATMRISLPHRKNDPMEASSPHKRDSSAVINTSSPHRRKDSMEMSASFPNKGDPSTVMGTSSPHRRNNPMEVMGPSSPHRKTPSAAMDTSSSHRRNNPMEVMGPSSPHRKTPSAAMDTCNLDQTRLEGSVSGPMQETNRGAASLAEHSHNHDASKSSSPEHFLTRSVQPLFVKTPSDDNSEQDRREEDEMTEDEDRTVFQRRNAMRFKPREAMKRTRSSPLHVSQHGEAMLKHPQVTNLIFESRSSEDGPLRNYSPCSWQSSPCNSPPTSPSITPRGATVASASVGATVRDLLFQPNIARDKVGKNDVYGLLLPETKSLKDIVEHPRHAKLVRVSLRRSLSDDESTPSTEATNNVPVVMRTNKSRRGQMNRKACLHGMALSMDTAAPVISLVNDMNGHGENTKLQSIPKADMVHQKGETHGGMVASNMGRVSDLVKQFDYSQVEEEEVRGEVREEEGEIGGRKKRLHRTIEKFEKSNSIKRKANPKPKAAGNAITSSNVPLSSASPSSPTTDSTDDSRAGLLAASKVEGKRNKSRLPSSAVIMASNTSDEEVLASPDHSPHSVAVISNISKGRLSTLVSDDAFVSARHIRSDSNLLPTSPKDQRCRNASLDIASEFDCIKPNDRLKHLTLSRPNGPQSRRKPRRFSAPVPEVTKKVPPHDSSVSHAKHRHFSVPGKRKDEGKDVFSLHHKRSPSHYFYQLPPYPTCPCPKRTSPESQNRDKEASKMEAKEESSMNEPSKLASGSGKSQTGNLSAPSTPTNSSKQALFSTVTLGSSSPSPGGQHKDKLSWLDLVTLAPERKQAVNGVKKGWADAGGVIGSAAAGDAGAGGDEGARGDKVKTSALSTREISHRVHDLKNSIREYEADFLRQHGRRPSSHEKSPIRTRLIELARMKKLFKERKESEEMLSQTAPPKISARGVGLCQMSANPASTTNVPSGNSTFPATDKAVHTKGESLAKEESTSGIAPSSMPVIEQTLSKIMHDIEDCRNKTGRPKDLNLMTGAQLQEEKHSIQKLLLDFEKHYGRPQSRFDKAVMRPLYDRYRVLKRKCNSSTCGGRTDSHAAGIQSGSATSLEEALPSITLLQSALVQSACDLSKPGVGLLEYSRDQSVHLGGGHTEEKVRERCSRKGKIATTQKKGCDASSSLLDVCNGADLISTATDPKDGASGSSNEPTHLLSERELQFCSHAELKIQRTLLLARKSELRRVLSEFETNFRAQRGRKVTKQDKKPVDLEYSKYKIIKGKLHLIEAFLTRPEPQ